MHTRAEIKLANDGRTALLTQGGETLRATLVGLPGATFSVTSAEAMANAPVVRNSDKPRVRRLTIETTRSGRIAFAVVFDDGTLTVPAALTPLDKWELEGKVLASEDREPPTVPPAPNSCKD